MKLKLKNKILLLYLVVGLCLALVIVALFSSKLKKDKFDTVYAGYQHRLSHIEFALATFLEGVEADLRGLPLNEFLRSRDGKLAGAVVTFRDITERKNAEEKIRNSEQRLAQIIDFSPDSAWVVDNDGKVVAWNKALGKTACICRRLQDCCMTHPVMSPVQSNRFATSRQ